MNPATPTRTPSRVGNDDLVLAVFCGVLLISNVAATKLVRLGPLTFDGGAIMFPLTYVLGDVLAEVYGLRRARRAILIGFVLAAFMSVSLLAVGALPADPDWPNQTAWVSVLGFVPRIVVASLCGYLAGQLLNAYVLVRVKRLTQGRALWARLVSSTVVGELADTVIFCTIAFAGTIPLLTSVNYTVTGFVYKVAVEVVCLPITYRVIAAIRRREPAPVG